VRPEEVVPPGEKGEIIACLDSDEAFAGYWNRPDADARALRDGWYFTGDMGHLDADRESTDLANFKRPRRIVFVKEIPKTASGKILRRLLRDGHDSEIPA
jgi:acyl-coenzyme A synthetase/AMP-(fatty) acid ligase